MSRNAALAIGIAVLVRLAVFAVAENKHGPICDDPVGGSIGHWVGSDVGVEIWLCEH